MSGDGTITGILNRASSGDHDAASELLPLVYRELRQLASGYLAAERSNHTLQPTALVHEAYIRLIGRDGATKERRNAGGWSLWHAKRGDPADPASIILTPFLPAFSP